MTRFRTLIFAVAAGLTVANLYLAQPLIELIAAYFDVAPGNAAVLVTVTQIGYALGILLIVPLGDILNRRRLVPLVLALSGLALTGAAFSPAFSVLIAALGCVGLTSVAAQLLTPLAGELAAPEHRGRVVGTIASGGLLGILLSRTVSGVIADLFGWRAIYLIVGIIALILALVLRAIIPPLDRREGVSYPRLIGSVFTTTAHYRAAPPTIAISVANFAIFSLFWTSLTYLLAAPPFSYTVTEIGLFGIAGLAGALIGRRVGVLHDRGWSVPANGFAFTLLGICLVAAWLAQHSIVTLIIVVVILDVGFQSNLVLSQTRMISLPGAAGSRLNTALVVSNFLGGAIGSALAGPLWALGGWAAIMIAALIITAIGLVVWSSFRSQLACPG